MLATIKLSNTNMIYLNDDRSFGNNPVIREVILLSPIINFRIWISMGISKWIFIGAEQTILQSHYTYKGNF